jgi:hypothetical protein
MRLEDRRKAIELRKQGKTYNEIRSTLDLSKSTLSGWLSDYPLTDGQLKALSKNVKLRRGVATEKCRLTKKKKRELRILNTYKREKSGLLPLNERELYLIGLFLYWGEGRKTLYHSLSLSNTDPAVVKFYFYWLTNILKIPVAKIKVFLHLYSDMDVKKTINFWSTELKIPKEQFNKPYIKESKRSRIDQKGYGYGTCNLAVNNILLKERVMLGIRAISDYYTENV